MNPNEYQLNENDKTRIKPLLKQVETNKFHFKYFVTIVYWYTMREYDKCCLDAFNTRTKLRSFFKSGIRTWFFIEKHTDPTEKNYGGFHLHMLLEDPADAWEMPSTRMLKWMGLEPITEGPETLLKSTPDEQQKMDLVKKVIQRLQQKHISQGKKGVDVRKIYDLERCLSYCSKQFERFLPSYKVIAPSSDIDLKPFLKFKQNGLQYQTRKDTILERVDKPLRQPTCASTKTKFC